MFVRLDEGGKLARSAKVNKLLIGLSLSVQTTGGHKYSLNGKDERAYKIYAEMICCMICTAGLPTKCWCYALQMATFIKCCVCSRSLSTTP